MHHRVLFVTISHSLLVFEDGEYNSKEVALHRKGEANGSDTVGCSEASTYPEGPSGSEMDDTAVRSLDGSGIWQVRAPWCSSCRCGSRHEASDDIHCCAAVRW